eukprot:766591-Pleurochrysis_carterae.AAC.3
MGREQTDKKHAKTHTACHKRAARTRMRAHRPQTLRCAHTLTRARPRAADGSTRPRVSECGTRQKRGHEPRATGVTPARLHLCVCACGCTRARAFPRSRASAAASARRNAYADAHARLARPSGPPASPA